MRRLRVADIRAVATQRPAGYLDAALAAGRVDGEWVEFEEGAIEALRERFGRGRCEGCATEPAMASAETVKARVDTCASCEELKPGTCLCDRFGCVSVARRAAWPICSRWPPLKDL